MTAQAVTTLPTTETSAKASRVPDDETPAECFARVNGPRVERVINTIRQIRKCAGQRTRYEYTAAQTEGLCDALTAEIEKLRAAFAGEACGEPMFRL